MTQSSAPHVLEEPRSRRSVGVVVLGMGRSGTSSVTRMFVKAGFFAGSSSELMGATASNPTGHWENLTVWGANEEILGKLSGSWFAPPAELAQLDLRDWAEPLLLERLKRLIAQSPERPLAVKDPRIGVLMPLWSEIIGEYLHPVLVIRDPVEIALSLACRDGTPVPFALAAWELHMESVLRALGGRNVTVAPYARLLEDASLAASAVRATAERLDPRLVGELRFDRAGEAFEKRLRHNRVSGSQRREHLTAPQAELWRLLASLPPGSQRLEGPATQWVASRAARSMVEHESRRLVEHRRRTHLATTLQSARGQTAAAVSRLDEERVRAGLLREQLQAERERRSHTDESLRQAERWLAAIERSASWRLTQPLRRFKRLVKGRRPELVR
ncbi:MAG TPA: hypothetical protein VHU13_00210 [Solirubrobacteraceae bacterium]|nr:hypothetical protein [Solirubrobacteraceae bacterium]